MKKVYALILFSFILIFTAFSQDKIVTTDGATISCKIISVDSSSLKVMVENRNESIITFVNKSEIQFYRYKGDIIYLRKKVVGPFSHETIFADSIERLNRYFLYTENGEIIFGKTIDYKTPFLGTKKFIVDSKEYKADRIKFYKDETGFYANTAGISFSGSTFFTERVRKGKINLYEKETTNYSGSSFNRTTGFYSPGFTTKRIQNYYNKGFGDLKNASYKNLSEDLADNPESTLYLEKFKSISTAQTILGIAGGSLIIIGFATLINKTKDWDGSSNQPEPNVTGSIITLAIGSGSIWTCYFLSFAKPKHLRKAIDIYNN